jgi:hypothetical protein
MNQAMAGAGGGAEADMVKRPRLLEKISGKRLWFEHQGIFESVKIILDDLFGLLTEVYELAADSLGLQIFHLGPDTQGLAVGGKFKNQVELLTDTESRRWLELDKYAAAA